MPKYKVFTNNKDLVKVGSTYAGKPVWGIAKCSENDTFDFARGYAIAKARCDMKVAMKREKRARKQFQEAKEIEEMLMDYIEEKISYYADARSALTLAQSHLTQVLENVR